MAVESGQSYSFWGDFRRFFLRGLSVIAPPMLTFAILVWAFSFIDRNIGQPVTRGMLRLVLLWSGDRKPTMMKLDDALTYGEPIDEFDNVGRRLTREYRVLTYPNAEEKAKVRVWWELFFRKYHLEIAGFVMGILLIYFVGYFLASFIGRSSWRLVERAFFRIPVVKAVYPHVKQVTDVVLAEKKLDVSAVVAVEYHRKGMWSLGFVVAPGLREIEQHEQSRCLTVFIPGSPTPFAGYAVVVRRDEIVELNVTLDEAVRFLVSCGVVVPGAESPIELEARTRGPWRTKS